MTQLVLLFAGFGLAYVVGFSAISVEPRRLLYGPPWKEGESITLRRRLVELLECPACLGWHLGALFGLWSDALVQGPLPLRFFVTGFAVAGFNYVAARLVKLIPPGYQPPEPAAEIAGVMRTYLETTARDQHAVVSQVLGMGGTQPPAGTAQ